MRLCRRPAAVRTVQRQRTVLCAVCGELQPVCATAPSTAGGRVPQSSTDGSIAVYRPGEQAGLSWSSVDPQAAAGASCDAERSAVPCAEIRAGSLKDGSSSGPTQICFMPSGRFRDRCAWTHEKWSQRGKPSHKGRIYDCSLNPPHLKIILYIRGEAIYVAISGFGRCGSI